MRSFRIPIKRISLIFITLVVILAATFSVTSCAALAGAWRAGADTEDSKQGDATSVTDAQATTSEADKPAQTTSATVDPIKDIYKWEGQIIEVYTGNRSFLALVDQPYRQMLGDKAAVFLYDDAKVLCDETGEPMDLKDAKPGQKVKVTITGGIRESYPVQASATEVRIVTGS
jgi:hypothetical protein